MSQYIVKMYITTEVEMIIDATSETSVRKLIDDNIIMTASLVDAKSVSFDVTEDSITELEINTIERL